MKLEIKLPECTTATLFVHDVAVDALMDLLATRDGAKANYQHHGDSLTPTVTWWEGRVEVTAFGREVDARERFDPVDLLRQIRDGAIPYKGVV